MYTTYREAVEAAEHFSFIHPNEKVYINMYGGEWEVQLYPDDLSYFDEYCLNGKWYD